MRKKVIEKVDIIKAAAAVFAQKGLENATVDDIASRAHIAKGSIYLHFKSKDEIFLQGVKYFAKQRIKTLQRLLQKYSTARKKLYALLKANHYMAEKSPEIFFMNYASLLSTHQSIKRKAASEFFKLYVDLVEEIVLEGCNKGEFTSRNPRLSALALILTQDLGKLFMRLQPDIIKTSNISKDVLDIVIGGSRASL